MTRQLLSISKVRESTISLDNLCQWLVTLTCSEGTSCVCLYWLWSCHWAPLERGWLHLFCTLPSGIHVHWKVQAEQSQLSQPSLIGEMLQSLHLRGPLLDSVHSAHVFLVLGTPELDAVLQMWPYQCRVEGRYDLLWSAGNALSNAV